MFDKRIHLRTFCLQNGRSKLVLLGAIYLTGCANFQGSIAPHVSLENIVDNVQCELKQAYEYYQPSYKWLGHWAASFTLTMKREDTAGVSPKLDFLNPDKFGIGVTGEVSSDTIRSMTTKRTLHLEDLRSYKCRPPPAGILTGRLGLFEALGEALHERGPDDVAGEEPDDLGYRIDYALKFGAGATPSWIFTRIPGVGAGFAGSRETTHTLDMAFTDETPHASKVCVVNLRPGQPLDCTIPPAGVVKPPPSAAVQRIDRAAGTRTAPGRVSPEVRQRLDNTLQRLQLENLLPQRLR
jgi:hypothetical protein